MSMSTITLHSGGLRLAANLFVPPAAAQPPPWPAVLIVHGFAGTKESHTEFGEYLARSGIAALALDLRGHGASQGFLDAGVLDDLGGAVSYLRTVPEVDCGRIVVRGSSLGGNLAVHAGVKYSEIAGVVAICPATESLLLPWVESGQAVRDSRALGLTVRLNATSFANYLRSHDLRQAVPRLSPRPLLLVQARGDQTVPYQSTVDLYTLAREPKRLLLLEGGDHRSAQHDSSVHAEVVKWVAGLAAASPAQA